jgi:hypothetical protein
VLGLRAKGNDMIGARAEAIGYVIVILSFTFALPSAAADTAKCIGKPTMAEYQACVDQEEGVMVGKYFCVIDNIAGLQDIEKVGRLSCTRFG